MTRFARSRGSKASNQRTPEEATPWSLLRQKVSDRGENSSEEDSREENKWEGAGSTDKTFEKNVLSVWCEFTEEDVKEVKSSTNYKKPKRNSETEEEGVGKSNKRKKQKVGAEDISFDRKPSIGSESGLDTNLEPSSNRKHKSKFQAQHLPATTNSEKWKKQNSGYSISTDRKSDNFFSSEQVNFEYGDEQGVVTTDKSRKVKKNVKDLNNGEHSGIDNSFSSELEDSNKHHEDGAITESSELLNDSGVEKGHNQRNRFNSTQGHRTIIEGEFRKTAFRSEPYKRRKLDQGDKILALNGEDIVLTKLDGFYIRKEDAVRIKKLERELFRKRVPNAEIRATVRRERRNAEKSLAREKKKVCFHCRNGGHNLSSCPKLSGAMGSGICYKCGSTEHSHLECKVSTGYKFAVCFICKEEGHIARECPDNPRGLYPQGGACNICGDVTHYRKDCPRLQAKGRVTADIMDDDLEAFTQQDTPFETKPTIEKKKKNKIIKFT